VNTGNTVNNFLKYFLTEGVKGVGLTSVLGTIATRQLFAERANERTKEKYN
jgi:hypothetical protein